MVAKHSLLSRLHSAGRVLHTLQAPLIRNGHGQIHPCNEFLAHLEREALRAERLGHNLRLVLLDLVDDANDIDGRNDELDQLASLLAISTRRSDYKGWYVQDGRWTIGLILCHTEANSVDAFLTKIEKELRAILHKRNCPLSPAAKIQWTIQVIPDDWNALDDDIRQLSLLDDDAVEDHSSTSRAIVLSNGGSARPAHLTLCVAIPHWKRNLDIIGALALILLFSPLLLLITLLIKLTSKGPILYKQNRVGLNGCIFKCLKFRTMQTGYDSSHHRKYFLDLIESSTGGNREGKPMVKLDKHNPQITLVGKILRPSHLDELPQLFNVLKGEMSLVGPRPCIPYEAERYQYWCRHRFETIPGITGLWQVKGKNNTTFAQMIRLDIKYILQRSLWLDLQILLMTVPTIIRDVIESLKPPRAKESNHAHKAKHSRHWLRLLGTQSHTQSDEPQ